MAKKNFGKTIAQLRARKRLGLREFARELDISAMHISNIEKGKSMPSPELLTKMAERLEADLDELLYLANQIDPAVVDVIQKKPQTIPNFLRSAKNLSKEQWEELQKQVDKMNNAPKSKR